MSTRATPQEYFQTRVRATVPEPVQVVQQPVAAAYPYPNYSILPDLPPSVLVISIVAIVGIVGLFGVIAYLGRK